MHLLVNIISGDGHHDDDRDVCLSTHFCIRKFRMGELCIKQFVLSILKTKKGRIYIYIYKHARVRESCEVHRFGSFTKIG